MDINDQKIEGLLRRLQLLDSLERRICVMRVQIGRQRNDIYGFNAPAFPSRSVAQAQVEREKLPSKNRPQSETAWLRVPLAPTQLPDTFRKALRPDLLRLLPTVA